MDARKNAMEAIRFGKPERVVEGPPVHSIGYLGVNHEGYSGGGHHLPVGSAWSDIWGTGWVKEHQGVMGFPRNNPLAQPTALTDYEWPDPDNPVIAERIYESAKHWNPRDAFLCGSHRDTLWEKGYMLVGMDNLMVYMLTEPSYAKAIFRRIMDFQLGIARHYLQVGVEMVSLSDDLGTQRGPLLSPAMVKEFLVPEYKRLLSLYKERNVIVSIHSCGNIQAFIPIFLELGVDILNPVQATANDLDEVRTLTQGRIALQGAVSTATLMSGPEDSIDKEVRHRIRQLGLHGGYFCAPDQGMPFPEKHAAAFHHALTKYGNYPIL